MEIPNRWLLLELPDKEYKIFGSWDGSYLNGESYRVNSGIESVAIEEDHYLFYGYSGSIYRCYKDSYGIANSYCSSVLLNILSKADGKIKMIEDKNNLKNIVIYLVER